MNSIYRLFLVLILLISIANYSHAQFSIYQSNPLGLLSKERIKIEGRLDRRNSMSIGLAYFWGICIGPQVFGEYRNYIVPIKKTELFWYAKAGYGSGDLYRLFGDYIGHCRYTFFGGGFGMHHNIGSQKRFFWDYSVGLKATPIISNDFRSYRSDLFYLTGPGSILDLHFYLGINL